MLIGDEQRSRERRVIDEGPVDRSPGAQAHARQEVRTSLFFASRRSGRIWRGKRDDGGCGDQRRVARPISSSTDNCTYDNYCRAEDCGPGKIRKTRQRTGEVGEICASDERQPSSELCCPTFACGMDARDTDLARAETICALAG
ncbi:MAG: hypothetical protein ACJ8AK_02690 [Gemmatimonadaceae bacterium]